MYELFEHTADLGIRVKSSTLNGLFSDAACALFAAVLDNPESIEAEQTVEFELEGTQTDYLLFDWLNELLYYFETKHVLFSEFSIEVSAGGFKAVCRGESLNLEKHHAAHEVKAITYHGLKVEQTEQGWQAELIVDI